MTNTLRFAMAGLLSVATFFAGNSEAGVAIQGTRVVYPSQNKEVTVKLRNLANKPALVQIWLDDGDEKSTPESAKVPFTVMPPVFRMEPSKGQVVRLLYTGQPLPTDKESLFWLNMLDIPPKADDPDAGALLQLATRTRIKVFFRPLGLPGNPMGAVDQLTWKLTTANDHKAVAIEVSNPTPYYVNFANVDMKVGDRTYVGEKKGGMVAPGGSSTFAIKGAPSRRAPAASIEFTAISDLGALIVKSVPLAP